LQFSGAPRVRGSITLFRIPRVSNRGLALGVFLALAAVGAPPYLSAQAPTPAPPKASENPPDVPARERFRPTPPQPESKFPPPQQSREAEERESNQPGEPDLLHGEPAVFLDGEPFPPRQAYQPKFPEARRLRYVAADAGGAGDGSSEHPWKDLQEALCKLEPGDRLLLGAGIYSGSFRVGGACRSGTADAPIQVFSRHAFLKPSGPGAVLTVERAYWQFWEVQIALLDSPSAGFVTSGPDAHHIAIDQSHIYEGKGPAVRLAAGSADVVLSNCHIHQSTGVRIEGGVSGVTLVNNHIHHNRSASVRIGGGDPRPARRISIVGNRIHNDRGPALDLAGCEDVDASRNRLSNYRPDQGRGGEAVVIGNGCRGVSLESNSVLEATVALRIGGDAREGAAPERIHVQRNYFENRLTSESVALRIDAGRDVRFSNNVVDHYAEAIRVADSGVVRAVVANNLVLSPTLAFRIPAAGIAFFDYNVFGAPSPPAAKVGGADAGPSWWRAHMPHSRVVSGADFTGNDLGKIVGFSSVDAGKAFDGLAFKGAAPDIGVAER
jgi:hypothetical protein